MFIELLCFTHPNPWDLPVLALSMELFSYLGQWRSRLLEGAGVLLQRSSLVLDWSKGLKTVAYLSVATMVMHAKMLLKRGIYKRFTPWFHTNASYHNSNKWMELICIAFSTDFPVADHDLLGSMHQWMDALIHVLVPLPSHNNVVYLHVAWNGRINAFPYYFLYLLH